MMTPQVENAIRSVARECRKAILAAIKGKPKQQHDPIITALLDQHAKKITGLPPGTFSPKMWLVYYIRLIDRESRGAS